VDVVADRPRVSALWFGDDGVAEVVGEIIAIAEPDLLGLGGALHRVGEIIATAVNGADLDIWRAKVEAGRACIAGEHRALFERLNQVPARRRLTPVVVRLSGYASRGLTAAAHRKRSKPTEVTGHNIGTPADAFRMTSLRAGRCCREMGISVRRQACAP
jgi:hypothetical protein